MRQSINCGSAKAIQVANDNGHSGKVSIISSNIMRFGPVPIVVAVPPQFADIDTHIASIALLDFDLAIMVKSIKSSTFQIMRLFSIRGR